MKSSDLIYQQVYKEILNRGGKPHIAAQFAAVAVEDYRKGRFKTVKGLISTSLKKAGIK